LFEKLFAVTKITHSLVESQPEVACSNITQQSASDKFTSARGKWLFQLWGNNGSLCTFSIHNVYFQEVQGYFCEICSKNSFIKRMQNLFYVKLRVLLLLIYFDANHICSLSTRKSWTKSMTKQKRSLANYAKIFQCCKEVKSQILILEKSQIVCFTNVELFSWR